MKLLKYEISISTLITFEILNENKTGTFRIEKKVFTMLITSIALH